MEKPSKYDEVSVRVWSSGEEVEATDRFVALERVYSDSLGNG